MDILEHIFKIQEELVGIMDTSKYPDSVEERISVLMTAIVHESIELQRLTNWKWWKKPVEFDKDSAKEELIDIFHFVIQSFIELDMSPEEILKDYVRKNNINRERQMSGY